MKVHHITRSVLLPYAVEDIFDLVANVGDYADFLPRCRRSRVLESNENQVLAAIEVVGAGQIVEMVTRNTIEPHQHILLEMVKGPFSKFTGNWKFSDLGIGCKATLDLSFEFEGWLLRLIPPSALEVFVNRVVKAFIDRAQSLLSPCE